MDETIELTFESPDGIIDCRLEPQRNGTELSYSATILYPVFRLHRYPGIHAALHYHGYECRNRHSQGYRRHLHQGKIGSALFYGEHQN